MHPIERLRYVARASHVPDAMLARETAMALVDFVGDDAFLLIACRQILARRPTSAVMVWLIAHVLGAPSKRQALRIAVETLENDPVGERLAVALPDQATVAIAGWSEVVADALRSRGDVRVVVIDTDGSADHLADRLIDRGHQAIAVPAESAGQALGDCTLFVSELLALGPEQVLAPQGTLGAAAVARHWDIPVWAVVGVGCALPAKMYEGLVRRWHEADTSPLWMREAEELTIDLISEVAGPSGLVAPAEAARSHECPIVPELF